MFDECQGAVKNYKGSSHQDVGHELQEEAKESSGAVCPLAAKALLS